jgi:hypothetical protein
MDRLSMKKFKFQTTTDVFMQCKIRACAQQPCGICTGSGYHYRELQDVDLSPAEGEMFAPPFNIKVSHHDTNALVFPDNVPDFRPTNVAGPAASIGQQSTGPAVQKAIQIKSNLVLSSITAAWAVQNREAVTATLRKTMGLTAAEELVITSISSLGRQLSGRQLQSGGGVKIDFVIGVDDQARASIAESKVSQLASGSPALAMQFSAVLDQELQSRGAAPIALPVTSMAFAAPTKTMNTYSQSQQVYSYSGSSGAAQQQQQQQQQQASDDRLILGLALGACFMSMMGFIMYTQMNKNGAATAQHYHEEESPDAYASKVAALDSSWQDHGEGQETW